MKNHTKLAAVVVVLTMSLSLSAMAKGGRPCRRGPRKGRKHRGIHGMFMRVLNGPGVLKEIGLSEAKAKQIKTILYNKKKQMIPIFAKIKIDRINVRQEYEKNTISYKRLLRIKKRIHNNHWRIQQIGTRAKVRVLNMLTVKQRTKIKELERRKFRKFHRRGRRRKR